MDHRELTLTHIESHRPGLRLALWHRPSPAPRAALDPVLVIHGATVPSLMSPGYPIEGYSWLDDLALAGHDVYALDFLGFGASDDYPEMALPRGGGAGPLGPAREVSHDIERAACMVAARVGRAIALVAISRGTVPAGYFMAGQPQCVKRLMLLSPIVRRDASDPIRERVFGATRRPDDAYVEMSIERRLALLDADRPAGSERQLPPALMERWVDDFHAFYDRLNRARHGGGAAAGPGMGPTGAEQGVRVPGGFAADLYDAWTGTFYDPGRINVPTLIVRGDYDRALTTAADVAWLYESLSLAPAKRLVTIDRATHSIQLERKRFELFAEARLFLAGSYGPLAAPPAPGAPPSPMRRPRALARA